METSGLIARGTERSCRHPPESIVLGNDRMEPTCALCGAELPLGTVLGWERDAARESVEARTSSAPSAE